LGNPTFDEADANNRVPVLTRGGIAHVPALVVLGFWILIQLFNGIGSMAATSETGGVANMAHIGGFVAGWSSSSSWPLSAGPFA
jgi:membrane associated rhomboid family serine protease